MSQVQESCYGGKNVCIRETPPEAPRVEVGPPAMNPNRETGGCMTETRQLSRQGGSVNTRACLPAQASHRPASRRHDLLARNRGALSQRGWSLMATDGSPVRAGRKLEDESAAATWAYRAPNVYVTLCPAWATYAMYASTAHSVFGGSRAGVVASPGRQSRPIRRQRDVRARPETQNRVPPRKGARARSTGCS